MATKSTSSSKSKTISQASYSSLVNTAKAQWKSDAQIAAAMKSTGISVAPAASSWTKTWTTPTPAAVTWKTISQSDYDRVAAAAKAQGKTQTDIDAAITKLWYTIGATPQKWTTPTATINTPTPVTQKKTVAINTPDLWIQKWAAPITTSTMSTTGKVDLSRINSKNAEANLRAWNISQAEYNTIKWTTPPIKPTEVVEPTQIQEPTETTAAVNKNMETFTAPNSKTYDIETTADGKAQFVWYDGKPKVFNTVAEAKAAISSANKTGTTPEYSDPQQAYDKTTTGEYAWVFNAAPIEWVNEQMQYADEANVRDKKDIDTFVNDSNAIANEMRQYNADVANNLDGIVWERANAMTSNFNTVNQSIKTLEEKANNLFDVNKMIARQNQFKNLANTWILTGEQAANATQYSLQDYTMNVELERAEIAKQMQEQITTALKEKAAMEDQILQQKWINETVKQGMMQNLNNVYNWIVEKSNTYLINANNKLDELITNANNTNVQVDLMSKWPMIEEKAKQDLVWQKLQQANTNPWYRYQYVLDTVTNIAPKLVGKVAAKMKEYQRNGTFMAKDANELISEIMSTVK